MFRLRHLDQRKSTFRPHAALSGAVQSTSIVITVGLAEIAAGSIATGVGGYLAGRSDAESALQTALVGRIAAAAASAISAGVAFGFTTTSVTSAEISTLVRQ